MKSIIGIAIVVLLVIATGAFFIGRSSVTSIVTPTPNLTPTPMVQIQGRILKSGGQ